MAGIWYIGNALKLRTKGTVLNDVTSIINYLKK